MKEWYTLKELLDVGGLPSTPQGIILYAKKINGVDGVSLE